MDRTGFRFVTDRTQAIASLLLMALLATTFAVYVPGLSGGFLFDDMVNLDALGRLGGIDSWKTLVDYLLGSHTGAGGRPIALVSFLLDGVDWPTSPEPFKYTNVLFHLLTMVGVIWLTLQLAAALGYDRRRQYAIALIAGAAWGLHPYLVSTVLYIVQRMAILAALFVIFGLGCYVRGRRLLAASHARAAYAWMTVGIVVFTPLAFLSKPNGGLLPVLALVLNATVLRHLATPESEHGRWLAWRSIFLYLPLALIIGYFALHWDDKILDGYAGRDFSLVERLLTQGRILADYAFHLLVPRIQTAGLYYDNYAFSRGLLTPLSTLFALIGILAITMFAILARKRLPVISAAVLFFLIGHAIESSFIPLELYFEHRNYLPSVLLAFALAVGIVRLFDSRAVDNPRALAVVTATLVLCVCASFTYARAQLWGNPQMLALTWETENPGSVRVQQQAAVVYMQRGLPGKASEQLAEAIRYNPANSLLTVQRLIPLCVSDSVSQGDIDHAARAVRQGTFNEYTIDQLDALGRHAKNGTCAGLGIPEVLHIVEAALSHTGVQTRGKMIEQLAYIRGKLLLAQDTPEKAQRAFLAAVAAVRNIEGAMQMAAVMASHHQYDYALDLLREAERDLAHSNAGIRERLQRSAIDYSAEIERLRSEIRADATRPGTAPAARNGSTPATELSR